MNNRKLLFVTYGGGHADIVARLVRKIELYASLEYSILALTTAGSIFDRYGIAYKRCSDYFPIRGYESAKGIGKKLSADIWYPSSGIPYDDSCAYLGVSMVDLINMVGEQKAWKLYEESGRKVFFPTGFINHVLDVERPDLVITTCYTRMEKAAVVVARRHNITSILIEDLLGYSLLGERSLDSSELVVKPDALPDHVIVLNDYVRQRFLQAGLDTERVHALGQPVFSEWVEQYESVMPVDDLVRLSEAGRPVITYVSPARRDVLYEQSMHMVQLAVKNPDWIVCIKLHPSVSVGEFESRIDSLPENVCLLQGEDILSVVKISDVVLIFRSTVGLLCIFCGVPLIVMDKSGEPEIIPYLSYGGARLVNRYEELERTVVEALKQRDDEKLSRRASSPVFENPPNAAENILSFFASSPPRCDINGNWINE